MKLKDILSKHREWCSLVDCAIMLKRNAEECKDAALLTVVERMLRLIIALANKEVDIREL